MAPFVACDRSDRRHAVDRHTEHIDARRCRDTAGGTRPATLEAPPVGRAACPATCHQRVRQVVAGARPVGHRAVGGPGAHPKHRRHARRHRPLHTAAYCRAALGVADGRDEGCRRSRQRAGTAGAMAGELAGVGLLASLAASRRLDRCGLVVDNLTIAIDDLLQRPRPYGVEILGGWTGFAMPSLPLAVLATFLINTVYSTVPAGRSTQLGQARGGHRSASGTVSRLYLAQDALTDALFGVVIGITVTLGRLPAVRSQRCVPGDLPPWPHCAP